MNERPEGKFQEKLCTLLTCKVRPEIIWMHNANGELRHPAVARRLKAMGVKPGVPDLCFLLEHGRTAWLELKSATGNLTPEQRGFGVKCRRLGHYWAVAHSMEDAVKILKGWNVFRPDEDFSDHELAA